MTQVQKVVNILLVEDNPDDVLITRKALTEARVANKLWVARDGQEALDFLYHKGKYQDSAAALRPGLILLDINLPKVNGLDVLKRIKDDPDLKRVPVVLLTVSRREEDIARGYNNGCNSFIQKPVEFEKFVEAIKQIDLYWGLLNIPSPNGLEQETGSESS